MLILVIRVVIAISTIIITQVKHEAFINEIVNEFGSIHIDVLYSSPHHQIFFNGKER